MVVRAASAAVRGLKSQLTGWTSVCWHEILVTVTGAARQRRIDAYRQAPWVGALQLWALWSFAVVQPLLQTLVGNTTFFLYHRAGYGHVLLLAIVLWLPAFGFFWLVEWATGRISPFLALGSRVLMLCTLAAMLFVQPLKQTASLLATWVFPLTLVSAVLAVAAYLQWAAVRRWLTLLSAVTPVLAGLFLLAPDVRALAGSNRARAEAPITTGTQWPNVVLIVFDGLPLVTLFDADFGIDRELFPNFSRLADSSHWFRNASTVSTMTRLAVPSILTGNSPSGPGAATLTKYPDNLFTLLDTTHRASLFEPVTKLSPREAPGLLEGVPPKVLVPILSDLMIVYRHFVTPQPWAFRLPEITGNWGGFDQLNQRPEKVVTARGAVPGDTRGQRFEQFVESIEKRAESQFFYYHALLPHDPTRYLPSGRRYREIVPTADRQDFWWVDSASISPRRYLRHLLQVQYADRLLGQLLDRLETQQLLDDSILVVCADHGQTFWPEGGTRRDLTTTVHPDDVLRVPLFIHRPGQTEGVVDDRNVDLRDVTPAVADLLGRELFWSTEGHSPFAPGFPHRDEKRLVDEQGAERIFTGDFLPDLETRALLASYFPADYSWRRLYRTGPMPELVGRQVAELATVAADFSTSIDDEAVLLDLDPSSELWPVRISGTLDYPGAPAEAVLALAINGRIEMTLRAKFREGRSIFSTLVAEQAIEAGSNLVELLIVDEQSGAVRRAQ